MSLTLRAQTRLPPYEAEECGKRVNPGEAQSLAEFIHTYGVRRRSTPCFDAKDIPKDILRRGAALVAFNHKATKMAYGYGVHTLALDGVLESVSYRLYTRTLAM